VSRTGCLPRGCRFWRSFSKRDMRGYLLLALLPELLSEIGPCVCVPFVPTRPTPASARGLADLDSASACSPTVVDSGVSQTSSLAFGRLTILISARDFCVSAAVRGPTGIDSILLRACSAAVSGPPGIDSILLRDCSPVVRFVLAGDIEQTASLAFGRSKPPIPPAPFSLPRGLALVSAWVACQVVVCCARVPVVASSIVVVATRPSLAVSPPLLPVPGSSLSGRASGTVPAWQRCAALACRHQQTGSPIPAEPEASVAVHVPAGRHPYQGAAWAEVLAGFGVATLAALLGSRVATRPSGGNSVLRSAPYGASSVWVA
jgi:hypothetical protein